MQGLSYIMGFISDKFTNPVFWVFSRIKVILENRKLKKVGQLLKIETNSLKTEDFYFKIYRKDYVEILLEALSNHIDKKNDNLQYDSSNVTIQKKMDMDVRN
jgi:hypothetical protein